MGLDQYAYVATKAGQRDEFYDTAEIDKVLGEYVNPNVNKPRELAYWRKHPNLQGWMERLWIAKGRPGFVEDEAEHDPDFNGVELELTWEDLDKLEKDIKSGAMAKLDTTGFFFGNPSDDHYREHDLEFIKNARAELFLKLKVFYNSSW